MQHWAAKDYSSSKCEELHKDLKKILILVILAFLQQKPLPVQTRENPTYINTHADAPMKVETRH